MDQKQVTGVQSQPVIPFSDIERMAVAFAKSGLFGIKTPEQGVALMLIAQAEGLHPAIAARDYHVIQGRPALKADAMLARFQQAGGKVVWNAYTDSAVSGTFSHPQGGSATFEWTIQQAKAAGLTNKDVWRQYPRAMLRARVISEGIRTVYPGASVGVYTPEELQDMDSKPATKEVQSEAVPVQEPKLEKPKADRDSLMKRLAACTWAREDLKYYCGVAFGVQASKDLTIEQLEQFVTTVESMDMPTAISKYADEQL
jgi:hypothetical protein